MIRTKKRKRDYMDEVDHILNEAENEINVSLLKQQSTTHSSTVIVYDYFNSPEASILLYLKWTRPSPNA